MVDRTENPPVQPPPTPLDPTRRTPRRVDRLGAADLARDYEWLFLDEVIGGSGTVGATSPGSKDLPEGILQTLRPGASP